jgi:L-lactate dehydrogenase complex protein LldF
MLVYLRRRKVESGHGDKMWAMGMKGYAAVMGNAKRFKRVLKLGKYGQKPLVRDGVIRAKIGPLKGWTRHRVFPSIADEPFRERWPSLRRELDREARPMAPDIRGRLEASLRRRQKGGANGHGERK